MYRFSSSSSSSPTWQLSRVYSVSIILWRADSFIAGSWQNWWEAAAWRRTEHQRDTSFFYSLAELSKSRIFRSLFSSAFSQVIGHFSASSRLVGCLLPWPDPCCGCNRGQRFYQFTGGFSTLPPQSKSFPERPRNSAEIWLLSSTPTITPWVIMEICQRFFLSDEGDV